MTKLQLILGVVLAGVISILINTIIVQACWNLFVPAVFAEVPRITLFQALVLATGIRCITKGDFVTFNTDNR
jgi:hypothetical protein